MLKGVFLYLMIVSTLIFAGCFIEGRVVDENGEGLIGITVTLSGDQSRTTITNSKGYYFFGDLKRLDDIPPGNYTVTPSDSGYTFTPTSTDLTLTSQSLGDLKNITGPKVHVDFVAEEEMGVPSPLVEGPITGGLGSPWIQSTGFDLAEVGYMQEEYFISGSARAFTNTGDLESDGLWTVVPASRENYKTRIVVYRPIDPQDFNGTVAIEWLNVSSGLDAAPDWTTAHVEMIREGYAWVGVSAQFVGVEGGGGAISIPGLGDLSLKGYDPVRYGSLNHPGDSFSYDIFSQAGKVIRSPTGVDPLNGLRPERVIALGESQSAMRLVTYVNAINPLAQMYDGFFIHSRTVSSAPLSQAPQPDILSPPIVRIRDDITIPVLMLQTETDLFTLGSLPDRQTDGPMFRLWEVAGTAHADTYTLQVGTMDMGNDPSVADVLVIAAPVPGIIECDSPINSGPQHFVVKAALAALNRWILTGEAPPTAPLLEVEGSFPDGEFVLDEYGNVLGGIRTPYVDVPIATLSGLGQSGAGFCFIFGTTTPFDSETLASLYPDHETYVTAVNEATDLAVEAGFILEPDGELIKAAAEASDIGL